MSHKYIYIKVTGLFLLFCLWGFTAHPQIFINGSIKDVATAELIAGVDVSLKNSSGKTESDVFGNFLLEIGDKQASEKEEYHFFYNSLIWKNSPGISWKIFSLDARLLWKEEHVAASSAAIMPRLQQGLYLIRIKTLKGEKAYKLYSDGHQTYLADKKGDRWKPQRQIEKDTIVLSKAGYFEREIPIQRQDTFLQISLMKGSYASLDYFNELIEPLAFELIQSSPPRSNVGGIKSVKFIDNRRDGLMYYMNTKIYKLHIDFAQEVLAYKQGNAIFNQTQYRENPDRYMYPGSINYYEEIDKYVLQLVAANEMTCENLRILYEKLLKTSYFGDKLVFFSNKTDWDLCEGVPKISFEELYAGQNYQALNLERNYGYLSKVKLDELEETYLGRHDIVLLDGIPNDVSVVAGIITTEFQTPLSHINVLSNSRGTPNMALRDGWDNPKLDSLLGELVYLEVGADSFVIRKANLEEAIDFWSEREPQTPVILEKDSQTSGLIDLTKASFREVKLIGGKAANFAEILKVRANGLAIPVPENSFAIPFYYYEEHLKQAGLDVFIDQLLADERFNSEPAYREAQLKVLRDRIKAASIDPALVNLVRNRIQNFQEFDAFRFRSSTNAEDLEDFSGAGLYSSHSAKKNHTSKTIENAIRKVWASLWNWRAFEERSYFKIDHKSCAMGILVHRSFPDEDANGVLLTRNLYNQNHGFIVNVQYKEYSIVFPEAGILHDQIMMVIWSNVPNERFLIEYLGFSNIPELAGNRVMSDKELNELGEYSLALKHHFFNNVPHECNCNFNDFALDIEFKVDSEVSPRKLYLKQARIFR